MDRKKCVICYKKINFSTEKYVKLLDYDGQKLISHCFYHTDCWQNRFVITQEKIMNQADNWMHMLSSKIKEVKPYVK
jgi:hypothetical protein